MRASCVSIPKVALGHVYRCPRRGGCGLRVDLAAPPELGKTPFVPGRERLSLGEVAVIGSGVLGRPFRYTAIDDERRVEKYGANPRVSEEMARHAIGMARLVKAVGSLPVSDVVRDVTGKEPIDLQAFLAIQVGRWR